jgi:hypothetical protein
LSAFDIVRLPAKHIKRISIFDNPSRKPHRDRLLRHNEHSHRRQDRERHKGQDQLPVRRVFALAVHHAERPGVDAVAIENDQRQQAVVEVLPDDHDHDGVHCDIAIRETVGRGGPVRRRSLGKEYRDRWRGRPKFAL